MSQSTNSPTPYTVPVNDHGFTDNARIVADFAAQSALLAEAMAALLDAETALWKQGGTSDGPAYKAYQQARSVRVALLAKMEGR